MISLFCGGEEHGDLFGVVCVGFGEVDEVHDGFEGVVDLVGDRGCHSAGGGDLLGLDEGGFHFFPGGDIAQDLGGSDDGAGAVSYGRDGEGDIEALSVFLQPDGFEVLDAFAGADIGDDGGLLGVKLLGDEGEDGFAEDVLLGVAEEA